MINIYTSNDVRAFQYQNTLDLTIYIVEATNNIISLENSIANNSFVVHRRAIGTKKPSTLYKIPQVKLKTVDISISIQYISIL